MLHDRACRTLSSQECVQMAQACEASRLSLYASANAVAAGSTMVDAPAFAERTCTPDEITAAPAWQAKSARDGRVCGVAHLSRNENSRARSRASRSSTPQENYSPSAARDSQSPCSNSDNSPCAHAEPAKNSGKQRAITCFKCGVSGHVASAWNSDWRHARKCYTCGGVGHIARVCPTRTAQSAANASSFTSGAVASSCESVGQLLAEAVIGGVLVADALVDTGSALSMLSIALYARLPDAPAIQPFPRDAP